MPAMAARFSSAEVGYDNALLSNFNLVALGNYSNNAGASVSTDGRVIVGGNFSNTGGDTGACYNAAKCSGNATAAVDSTGKLYGALTVFGNVTAAAGGRVSAGYTGTSSTAGTTYIGGTASGYYYAGNNQNLNIVGSASGLTVDFPAAIATSQASFAGSRTNGTGTVTTSANGNTAASVFPFTSTALRSEINHLASGIAALPGSPGVKAQALPSQVAGNGLFTANADWTSNGKTYGVVTTTLANLAGQTNFQGITNGTNAATFVIVTGGGANDPTNYILPNLNSYADASKVIFEFVDATTLKFAGAWNGSILAPLASITQMGGQISGTVIVNNITQSQSLLSSNLFAGDLTGFVPEPASLTLFGIGAAAAALARRKRRGLADTNIRTVTSVN